MGWVGTVGASTDLAGEVGLAHAEVLEAGVCTLCAAVVRANVWVRLELCPGGLLCAFTSATFSVEGTVSVIGASGVDAEGDMFVTRVSTGVLIAIT